MGKIFKVEETLKAEEFAKTHSIEDLWLHYRTNGVKKTAKKINESPFFVLYLFQLYNYPIKKTLFVNRKLLKKLNKHSPTKHIPWVDPHYLDFETRYYYQLEKRIYNTKIARPYGEDTFYLAFEPFTINKGKKSENSVFVYKIDGKYVLFNSPYFEFERPNFRVVNWDEKLKMYDEVVYY
ncbi:MAG: hypothetical protein CV087_22345 [Candidatus Brocadia sp. WS118]|nr:MAG: hypothetical protein CV087_22345 [Candidatus Brocadia sp. WS118]